MKQESLKNPLRMFTVKTVTLYIDIQQFHHISPFLIFYLHTGFSLFHLHSSSSSSSSSGSSK